MTIVLPKTIDDITLAWIESCLATRWPGLKIAAMRFGTVLHGAATKIRLFLDYEPLPGGEIPPASMWLKIGFEPHHDMMMGIYTAETTFFKSVRSLYDLHAPVAYFAVSQQSPSQFAIFLEDLILRDAEFNSAVKPLSIDEAAAGLSTLALIHGQSWGDERLSAIGIKSAFVDVRDVIETYHIPHVADFFGWTRAYAAPVALLDQDRFKSAIAPYISFSQRPDCLLHGDTHIGNTYKEAGGIGFLDWQMLSIGNWVHDVSYFLISSLDIPDRRAAERDLLVHYLDCLGRHRQSPGPGFDEAWEDYRRAAFQSFFTWISNSDDWQAPEINMSCYARASAAMMDLDSYTALGV
ncbi:MAG: phosphotransferase [Sphingomonadaceae bacterium]